MPSALCIVYLNVFRKFHLDRQSPYNVTLKRVRATIVVVEKQCVFHNPSVCL